MKNFMEIQSCFLMSVPQLWFSTFCRNVANTIKNHVDYPYFLLVTYANGTALPFKLITVCSIGKYRALNLNCCTLDGIQPIAMHGISKGATSLV